MGREYDNPSDWYRREEIARKEKLERIGIPHFPGFIRDANFDGQERADGTYSHNNTTAAFIVGGKLYITSKAYLPLLEDNFISASWGVPLSTDPTMTLKGEELQRWYAFKEIHKLGSRDVDRVIDSVRRRSNEVMTNSI